MIRRRRSKHPSKSGSCGEEGTCWVKTFQSVWKQPDSLAVYFYFFSRVPGSAVRAQCVTVNDGDCDHIITADLSQTSAFILSPSHQCRHCPSRPQSPRTECLLPDGNIFSTLRKDRLTDRQADRQTDRHRPPRESVSHIYSFVFIVEDRKSHCRLKHFSQCESTV